MTLDLLAQPLKLPCGATLPNRLCKAAMTEGLADGALRATERHVRLYRQWSAGGCGLLLTGNVQVDHRCLERPANVAIDGNAGLDELRAYARAGTQHGTHLWMQIAHAGRQSPRYVTGSPLAPSPVQLQVLNNFAMPRAATEEDILDVIRRFANVARIARETGFTGVQVHSAHGYLLSSFLSPVTNQRTDAWGGSLENRARIVIESVRAVRAAVGADFPVSVKLNSDDFRKGGFSNEDCLRVVEWLNAEQLDLLEISGGTYEQPKLLGAEGASSTAAAPRESTRQREAYFIDYAERIRAVAKMPMMVTGGFRSRAAMEEALSGACDMIGIGRPLVSDPACAKKLLARQVDTLPAHERVMRQGVTHDGSPVKAYLRAAAEISWYYIQIFRLADGLPPDPRVGTSWTRLMYFATEIAAAWRLRRAKKRGAFNSKLSAPPA
ncbi:MAG TPA: NADH:flavin oxidoreductase/NADH oxidase family protein [Verrucomicrobiae bacterium]|nr:NADH:flavin oxidoreductase/NADH oxidase family protein [Verrucomicrobiae bacterium]